MFEIVTFDDMYRFAPLGGYNLIKIDQVTTSFDQGATQSSCTLFQAPSWRQNEDKTWTFTVHKIYVEGTNLGICSCHTSEQMIEGLLQLYHDRRVRRAKQSGMRPAAFAARYLGMDSSQAERFGAAFDTDVEYRVECRHDVERAYSEADDWSFSCMTSRSARTQVYAENADVAFVTVFAGSLKIGRTIIMRPRKVEYREAWREPTLPEQERWDATDLNGWYYIRPYGAAPNREYASGDCVGTRRVRTALEALGCKPDVEWPDGHRVDMKARNGYAPWWDGNQGMYYGESDNRKVSVCRSADEPRHFAEHDNNLDYDQFGECSCRCDNCDERIHDGDITYIGDQSWCSDCRDEHYVWADDCDDWISRDDAFYDAPARCWVSEIPDGYVMIEDPIGHHKSASCYPIEDCVEIGDSRYYRADDINRGRIAVVDGRIILSYTLDANNQPVYEWRVISEQRVVEGCGRVIDVYVDGDMAEPKRYILGSVGSDPYVRCLFFGDPNIRIHATVDDGIPSFFMNNQEMHWVDMGGMPMRSVLYVHTGVWLYSDTNRVAASNDPAIQIGTDITVKRVYTLNYTRQQMPLGYRTVYGDWTTGLEDGVPDGQHLHICAPRMYDHELNRTTLRPSISSGAHVSAVCSFYGGINVMIDTYGAICAIYRDGNRIECNYHHVNNEVNAELFCSWMFANRHHLDGLTDSELTDKINRAFIKSSEMIGNI